MYFVCGMSVPKLQMSGIPDSLPAHTSKNW